MPTCKTDHDICDAIPSAGETWSVCLPWGGRIWRDGHGTHAVGGEGPPDGVYGKVVISNGCLVGVEPEDVPLYTGSPCAPQPGNCGGASAAAVMAAGLEDDVPTGRAMSYGSVSCWVQAGDNVIVRGEGTEDNPYIISADKGVYIRSENHAIIVDGDGTRNNPLSVQHKLGYATTINGMTFDAFGHLTSAIEGPTAGTKGIAGIIPGYGIQVDTDIAAGVAKVSVQPPPDAVKADAQFGAYAVSIDEIGRITAIKQNSGINPATLACGATDISVNSVGSITNYTETFDTGASYLCVWSKPDIEQLEKRGAQFTLRVGTSLMGRCIADSDTKDLSFYLDGQECGRIGDIFWGNGIYIAGQHVLEIKPVPDMDIAVILHATAFVDELW